MYTLLLAIPSVNKDLRSISSADLTVLNDRIKSLAGQTRQQKAEKLTGPDGYRLRVGSCRILCAIDDHART